MSEPITERLQIPYPIIVEGKYDRLRLLSILDGEVYTTDGFAVFRKDEKAALFRALARKTPIIVLTDSDGAGKVIRRRLSELIPRERLIPLYVPQIPGKEARKSHPSKEGLLGVEGMERRLLYELLLPYADPERVRTACAENPLSKLDLYVDGLTGAPDSRARRDALAERVGLPRGMTPNALLAALRVLCTYPEYCRLVSRKETPPNE